MSPEQKEPIEVRNLFPIKPAAVNAQEPQVLVAQILAGYDITDQEELLYRAYQADEAIFDCIWVRARVTEQNQPFGRFNTSSYGLGVLLGYTIFEQQAELIGGTLPHLSPADIERYELRLYGGARNRAAVKDTTLTVLELQERYRGLDEDAFEQAILRNHPELERSGDSHGYRNGVRTMLHATRNLGSDMYRKEEALRPLIERIKEGKDTVRNGSGMLGLADIYTLFEINRNPKPQASYSRPPSMLDSLRRKKHK